ncbi:hypothetical protein HKD37_03G006482 [Glycine soja]
MIVIIKNGEIVEAMPSKIILMMPKNQELSKFQRIRSKKASRINLKIQSSFNNQDSRTIKIKIQESREDSIKISTKNIQRTNRLRILCLNTLEGTSFVAQVEGTSTWVVVLRTREGTSLVDQFKWRVNPLGCSKRTREGTSLVDLWLVKDFTRLKEISRTVGCMGTGCRHGLLPN